MIMTNYNLSIRVIFKFLRYISFLYYNKITHNLRINRYFMCEYPILPLFEFKTLFIKNKRGLTLILF